MRILVIEDEHKIANSIKKGLQQEAYAVDVAYDGENGFDMASLGSYDVIILDWLLSGTDGVTVCRKLREQKMYTPILILTAKGQVADRVNGLNSGADDYMVKPFAFEELLARLRALIRRPKETLGTILTVAELKLDPLTFEVMRSGKAIHLSHKEFSLLEYLMQHPNQIISKGQIIEHVWDYDADVLPNTVEVYIGYLRNKIDKPFPQGVSLIHTVRGFGYKIGEK